MKTISVALLAVSSWITVAAQDGAPNVSPAIVQVVSGGYWEAGSQHGMFRAIVENQGFEHVSSRLWLEWVAEPDDAQAANQVVTRVEVSEISRDFWSVHVEPAEPPFAQGILRVSATQTHSLEERVFTIDLGSVGEYRIVSP